MAKRIAFDANELVDIIGNDRSPDRAVLKYIYDLPNHTILFEFSSNKTWSAPLAKSKVIMTFYGVDDYHIEFPRPRIPSWAKIDGKQLQP